MQFFSLQLHSLLSFVISIQITYLYILCINTFYVLHYMVVFYREEKMLKKIYVFTLPLVFTYVALSSHDFTLLSTIISFEHEGLLVVSFMVGLLVSKSFGIYFRMANFSFILKNNFAGYKIWDCQSFSFSNLNTAFDCFLELMVCQEISFKLIDDSIYVMSHYFFYCFQDDLFIFAFNILIMKSLGTDLFYLIFKELLGCVN